MIHINPPTVLHLHILEEKTHFETILQKVHPQVITLHSPDQETGNRGHSITQLGASVGARSLGAAWTAEGAAGQRWRLQIWRCYWREPLGCYWLEPRLESAP